MPTLAVPEEDFLTAPELARLLRVDVKTVRRHAADLDACRVGRTLRFPFPRGGQPNLASDPPKTARYR